MLTFRTIRDSLMATLLRVLIALISVAALIPLIGGMVFLCGMGQAFGPRFNAPDYLVLSGMLLSFFYFLVAFVTCLPRFPFIRLQQFGMLLHFVVMPTSILLVCLGVGSHAAIYLVPGIAFAMLWFVMARTVIHSVP